MSKNKFPPKPKYDPDTGPVYLYGIHTVRAALDNPRRLKRELLVTPNALTPSVRRSGRHVTPATATGSTPAIVTLCQRSASTPRV